MSNFRKKRVADLLLSFLGGVLLTFHEPKLRQVTLTGLEVTPDLKYAKIFWVFSSATRLLGDDAKEDQSAALQRELLEVQGLLDGACFELRKSVAKELNLRYTPQLKFVFDQSMDNGLRIEELLKKAGF